MKRIKILLGLLIFIITILPTIQIYSDEEATIKVAPKKFEYIENMLNINTIDIGLAEDIEFLCRKYSEDIGLCVKHIVGVSSAESSVFKRCSGNNCFGLMRCTSKGCSLRRYESLRDSIEDWLKLYQKNKWYLRKTGQSWLDGRYCTSACAHWTNNYQYAINKLNI